MATTVAATTALALVAAAPASAQVTVPIQPSHVPTTAEDFAPNDQCDDQFDVIGLADDKDGWHFVALGRSSFEELMLTFTDLDGQPVAVSVDSTDAGNPSTGPGWSGYFTEASQGVFKHAWVVTDAGWTLTAGTAQVDDPGRKDFFVLSHTCAGEPGEDENGDGENGEDENGEDENGEDENGKDENGDGDNGKDENGDKNGKDVEEPAAVPTEIPAGTGTAGAGSAGNAGLVAMLAAFAVGAAVIIRRRFLTES